MHNLRQGLHALRRHYLPIVFIGLAYLAITMMWTLYSAFVPVFLDMDYGMRAAAIGLVMMLDNMAGVVIQPWIGARSDRLRTPLGRRLPIILLGAPLAAISFAAIPVAGQRMGGLLGFFAVLIVMLVAMAAIRVPLFALMPDLTPASRRSTANGIINFFGGLGTLIAALGLSGAYRVSRTWPFVITSVFLVIAVAMLALVIWRVAPEQVSKDPPGGQIAVEEDASTWQMVRDILAENWRGTPLLLLSILLYTFGFNGIETFFSLYGRNQLGIREERALMLLGLLFLAYLLASIPAGILGECRGRRRAMIWGLIALSLLLGIAFVRPSVPLYLVFMPLGGIAWAFVNSNALPAVVDTALPHHAGSAVGLYYFSATLASVLSPPINGWAVDRIGGDYGVIALTASLSALLGALCLVLIRRSPRTIKRDPDLSVELP